MRATSPLMKVIDHQLSSPIPAFEMNWYTIRADQYSRIQSFISYAQVFFEKAYETRPVGFLQAIAEAEEKNKTIYLPTDANGNKIIKGEPISSAMLNISEMNRKNNIVDKDKDMELSLNLANEFFLLTGEICGTTSLCDTDTLLICMDAQHREDSLTIEGSAPEKKYLFAAFMKEKGFISDQDMEDNGALLGRGPRLYAEAQEKIDILTQYAVLKKAESVRSEFLRFI